MAEAKKATMEELLAAVLTKISDQNELIIGMLQSQAKAIVDPRHTLKRIAEIKKNAKERPDPTNHVDPGFAIIKTKGGKARKLVDLAIVMSHNCHVELGDGQVVQCGGRWDELKAGSFILEQYAPYPKPAIKVGAPTYFNPEEQEYKEVDGVMYHPVYGDSAIAAYRKSVRTGIPTAMAPSAGA